MLAGPALAVINMASADGTFATRFSLVNGVALPVTRKCNISFTIPKSTRCSCRLFPWHHHASSRCFLEYAAETPSEKSHPSLYLSHHNTLRE